MKKKLIRSGVFETNSSSSHSISIGDENKHFVLDMLYPNKEGIIILLGGEFGWDWFKHNDALTKANYAAVAHQHNPDLVIDVIKEQTGADHVVLAFTGDYDGPNWSYIDHDSAGVCPSTKEELRNFIFNKNSWLFGGNDNSRPAPNFYNVPTYYQDGSVEEIKYTHKLTVVGYDKIARFTDHPTNDQIVEALEGLLDGVRLTYDGKFYKTNVWSSTDNYFQFDGWRSKPNLKKQVILFINNRSWHEAMFEVENKMKKNEIVGEVNKYAEIRKIEDEWIKARNKRFVKEVKYSIDAI